MFNQDKTDKLYKLFIFLFIKIYTYKGNKLPFLVFITFLKTNKDEWAKSMNNAYSGTDLNLVVIY